VNFAKKTPYAAGIGVHKASTGLKNKKTTIFNIYFSYLFERTLPYKLLDRHQCQ